MLTIFPLGWEGGLFQKKYREGGVKFGIQSYQT